MRTLTSFDAPRRHFLRETACGLSTVALANLLAEDECTAANAANQPSAPKAPHHRPTAKNVIFLFMAGAPSQLDLFTPKAKLKEFHGQRIPASFVEGLDDSLIKGSARVFASPRKFQKYGECGMDFSDYLPHLAGCADQLCMIRSMTTDVSNHHPGQLLMNCGVPTFGLPSMGSWVTYGLGSTSRNMPAFMVLLSRNGAGDLGGQALWDSAFLPCCPSRHSGVFCASSRHFPVRDSARFQSSFPCEAVNRRCDDGGMTSTTRIQKKYDHRLRELVRSTGAVEHAIQLGVPRSTAHGCSHRRRPQVARTRAENSRMS